MGGHGGLNILPQKRWNVYNFDNREKVRQDEEAAARDEQLKREQSRRRDAEFRIERLRQSRGLPSSSLPSSSSPTTTTTPAPASPPPPSPDSRHINLFDGLQGFSSLVSGSTPDDGTSTGSKKHKTQEAEDGGLRNAKKQRKEEPPRTVTAEDEKYKLGYGLVGKGVKAPWYMSKAPPLIPDDADEGHRRSSAMSNGPGTNNGSGKKTIEELREERMKREKQEKERARALLGSTAKKGADRGFSRRRY